jgi:hypothetical protein
MAYPLFVRPSLSFSADSFFKPRVIFHYPLQLSHKVSSPLVFLTWVTLEIRALCLRCTFQVTFTNFTILHFALNLDGKVGGGGGGLAGFFLLLPLLGLPLYSRVQRF